jgi:hypothetical protein
MLDHELLKSIAIGLMAGAPVDTVGRPLKVRKTSAQRLKVASFTMNGRQYEAIEQNRYKPSRWGQLAKQGHQVVQIRDVGSNKYVAVVVDGEVTEYGSLGPKH